MKKNFIPLMITLASQMFLMSCNSDPNDDPTTNKTNIIIAFQNAELSITQTNNGKIFTFTANPSTALKSRNLSYTWDIDYNIDGSTSTSSDGKTFTVDTTDFPNNVYTVTLCAEDKTELSSKLENEGCDNSEIQYRTQTTFFT